jgi:glucose-1-phosphate cytidylyltransferase
MTYGDGVSNIDLHALIRQHKATDNIVTLSAIQPGGRFGVLDIDDNDAKVTGFREKATEDGGWINAGFMVMGSEIFSYINDDRTILEREPLERLSAEGNLGVYKHYGFWQCMDTQRDKGMLEKLWVQGQALWKVWED